MYLFGQIGIYVTSDFRNFRISKWILSILPEFLEFLEFSKIPVYFRRIFLVSIFGKIFDKFRKFLDIQNQVKYTGLVLDFEIPGTPKYREPRNTKKVERPKILG